MNIHNFNIFILLSMSIQLSKELFPIQYQLGCRPRGKIPPTVVNYTKPETWESELTPYERSAIRYISNSETQVLTEIFNKALEDAITSKRIEEEKRIIIETTKEQIETQYVKYVGVFSQINLLKIIKYRTFNNLSDLIDFVNCSTIKKINLNNSRNKSDDACMIVEKSILVDLYHFFKNIDNILNDVNKERSYQNCLEHISKLQIFLELFEQFSPSLSVQMMEAKNQFKEDLQLLRNVLEAPGILLPLLIRSLMQNEGTSECSLEQLVTLHRSYDEVMSSLHKYFIRELNLNAEACRKSIGNSFDTAANWMILFDESVSKAFKTTTGFELPLNLSKIRVSSFEELIRLKMKLQKIPKIRELQTKLQELNNKTRNQFSSLKMKPKERAKLVGLLQSTDETSIYFVQLLTIGALQLTGIKDRLQACYDSYIGIFTSQEVKMKKGIFKLGELLCVKLFSEIEQLNIEMQNHPEAITLRSYVTSTLLPDAYSRFCQILLLPLSRRAEELSEISGLFKESILHLQTIQKMGIACDDLQKIVKCFYHFCKCYPAHELLWNVKPSENKLEDNDYEHQVAQGIFNQLCETFEEYPSYIVRKNRTLLHSPEQIPCFDVRSGSAETNMSIKMSFLMMNNLIHYWETLGNITRENWKTKSELLLSTFFQMDNSITLMEMEFEEKNLDISVLNGVKWDVLYKIRILKEYLTNVMIHAPQQAEPSHSVGIILDEIEDKEEDSDLTEESKYNQKEVVDKLIQYSYYFGQPLSPNVTQEQVLARDYIRDQLFQIQSHHNRIVELESTPCVPTYSLNHHRMVLWALCIEQTLKMTSLLLGEKEDLENILKRVRKSHDPIEFKPRWINEAELASLKSLTGFIAGSSRYMYGSQSILTIIENYFGKKTDPESIQQYDSLIESYKEMLSACFKAIDEKYRMQTVPQTLGQKVMPIIEWLVEAGAFKQAEGKNKEISLSQVLAEVLELLKKHKRQAQTVVQEVSVLEKVSDLKSRLRQVRINKGILAKNLQSLDEVLKDSSLPIASKAMMVLTRGAVLYEKTLQSLVAVLPVVSDEDENKHYLFGGKRVINQYGHKTNEAVKEVETVLADIQISEIADRQSWVEQFISQVYRYPFTPSQEYGAEALRRFAAFADLRAHLVEKKLSLSELGYLQELLGHMHSDGILEAFDEMVEKNMQEVILVPLQGLMQDVAVLLKVLIDKGA